MTQAWHLRQDGKAFPVSVHMYVENDEDYASEADAASFLIKTKSKDIELAEYVLDIWMALLIENSVSYDDTELEIESAITDKIKSLPYHFNYSLTTQEYLDIHRKQNNFTDTGSLYDFLDDISENKYNISESIRRSLNQQFCRVRYGGQYDTFAENSSIWFRISSAGYNWANTIYVFTANNYRKLKINSIYICRDYESDNGDLSDKEEYFYKAKDGSVYFDMPIDEYLAEEHEHSPVFSSQLNSGALHTLRTELYNGSTYHSIISSLSNSNIRFNIDPWYSLVRKEYAKCIDCSDLMDTYEQRIHTRRFKTRNMILQNYPEITDVIIESEPYANKNNKMVGVKYIFNISSNLPELDGTVIDIPFTKGSTTPDQIFRRFRQEYNDYKLFNTNI